MRTTDGLRVALAGLPDVMPVVADADLGTAATTVGEARKISEDELPTNGISLSIPYRLMPDSVVRLRPGDKA